MSEYKKFLKMLGFVALRPSMFFYDNNGIYYIVSIGRYMSRWRVGFEVSHKGLFDKSNPKGRSSPVGDWDTSFGVFFGVNPTNIDEDRLRRITVDFFSSFKSADDYLNGLQSAVTGKIICEIDEYKISEECGGTPAWFPEKSGGILTVSETWKKLKDLMVSFEFSTPLNYNDFLFSKRREASTTHDCIYIWTDQFGVFLGLNSFVWDDRWVGDDWSGFHDFANLFIPKNGPVRTIDFISDEDFRVELVSEAITYFRKFTISDYLSYVIENGNYFGKMSYPKLKRLTPE